MSAALRTSLFAFIQYADPYVQPLLISAFTERMTHSPYTLLRSMADYPSEGGPLLQWRQYESVIFEYALEEDQALVNAYIIRKALIRKHFLSTLISNWITKHPSSLLREHFKPSVDFELDYAEFLDDALLEAFELRESFEKNDGRPPEKREWWILKPSMSDRGQGIRLFGTEEELSSIFEDWEAELSDSEDDDDNAVRSHDYEQPATDDPAPASRLEALVTSHLRHFVCQPYIHPPLLLPSPFRLANHKFHIRTYILAVGALHVYVYKPMLALFSSTPYRPPWESTNTAEALSAHLTNTCVQNASGSATLANLVHSFWSLPALPDPHPPNWKERVFVQICATTSEIFRAAAVSMPTHFQPHPNMFEIFGVDFLVDGQGTAWLLEVNAFPDFAMTGEELREEVVGGLFEEVVEVAVKPFFGIGGAGEEGKRSGVGLKDARGGTERMRLVLDLDMGRR